MKINNFDIAQHLDSDDDIRQFLIEVATEGDESDLIHALNIAARAKGMSSVAKQAGVTRASLYKSLSEDGSPKFSTISKVIASFGCKLAVI
jgi:probable addiction module antidote protein